MRNPNKRPRSLPYPDTSPHLGKSHVTDRPISDVYPVIDNDLARDNLENDIPAADLPE